jgi:hypothetical protein
MKMTSFGVALALSLGISAVSAAPQVASATAQRSSDDKKDVTITGCVVKGDGGYVLTNVAEQTASAAIAGGLPSTPQPAGTVMPGRVLYWMSDDDELAEHAGHKVEVRGELEGEIEKGKISAEREGGLVELEFKVDGDKKVTIKVPDVPPTVGTSGSIGDKEVDLHYIVRKIDVDSVKMITSTCR